MNIKLDTDTAELIDWHAKTAGLPANEIIEKLLGAHLHELWELRTFLEAHPTGTEEYERGKNLLISFGPDSVLSGIKQIAPTYKTLETQFLQSVEATGKASSDLNH